MSPRVVRPKPAAVGVRLRRCRNEAGYTLRELAELTSVTPTYLSRVEHGIRNPSIEVLIELAAPLHTTGLYLLTGLEDARCPFCGRDA